MINQIEKNYPLENTKFLLSGEFALVENLCSRTRKCTKKT